MLAGRVESDLQLHLDIVAPIHRMRSQYLRSRSRHFLGHIQSRENIMHRNHLLPLVATLIVFVGANIVFAEPTKSIEPTEVQLQAAIKAFEELGGRFEKHVDSKTMQSSYKGRLTKRGNSRAVGDDELTKIPNLPFSFWLDLSFTKVTDAGLKKLATLENLSGLFLSDTQVTDAGLTTLAAIENLSVLNLNNTKVTDEGLKELAAIINLTVINLSGTKVTDAGMAELAKCEQLSTLALRNTEVSDAGLKELIKLQKLSMLVIGHTRVTRAGKSELKLALSQCQIVN